MKNWLVNFPLQKLSIFATIVVSFTYNVVFDGDLFCKCKKVQVDCSLYMAGPFFIFFLLMIWTDQTCLRACRFKCPPNPGQGADGKGADGCQWCRNLSRCSLVFCGLIWSHIFKAFLVGLLWVVSVLVDGDWYVCCGCSEMQSELACKDKNIITAEEKMNITQLKSTSKHIGFGGLLSILLVLTVMSALDWKKCCKYNKRQMYYKIVLKKNEEVLKTTLKEAAEKDLTEKIKRKISQSPWEECFVVASDMIDNSCEPTCSPEPNQQLDQ